MNAEHILDALGDVRDEYVADADRPVRPRHTARRLAMLAAVLILCLALAIPAAAYTDAGYTILYALSPAMAQSLKPVNETCEANGVRMTVDSAVIEGNAAYIRIALTDLEGDLFDGTIDLYDSYDIKKGFDASVVGGSCMLESYDEESRTAVFLAQLAPLDGTVIRPGKVTFSVGEFCGHTEIWEEPIAGVDLAAADEVTQTVAREGWLTNNTGSQQIQIVQDVHSGVPRQLTSIDGNQMFNCLVPGEPIEVCPGAAITGLGWIDGMLHVQVCRPDYLDTRTGGMVYLTDTPGELMEDSGLIPEYARVQFYSEDERDSYEEYIFDITPQQAESLTLQGWFQLLSQPVQGPWEVTFPLA